MDMISIDLTDENQSHHNISNITNNSLWQVYQSADKSSVSKFHNHAEMSDVCNSQSFLRIAPLEFSPEPDAESTAVINLTTVSNEESEQEPPSPIQSSGVGSPQRELTDEERKRKEEEDSERLAWELMQQEQNELYQIQLDYMRSQAQGMSEEDMRALELVLQEATGMVQYQQPQDGEFDDEEEDEEGDEMEEDPNQWDYERLLELGNVLGDVKTERWRLRANKVIQSLPTTTYEQIVTQIEEHQQQTVATGTGKSIEEEAMEEGTEIIYLDCSEAITNPSILAARTAACATRSQDYRCAVCMENYETADEVYVLPCAHYFHLSCGEGWLHDHNSCPICKVKVTASP